MTLNSTYNAYSSGLGETSINTKVDINDKLPYVTWAKLVRGRWCLVASSDATQSRLSVFDGLCGMQDEKYVFYLDGPVMDGVVEDTPQGINLALSIGAR